MEALPTQGQTLRHYTASRPRPRRTYTQPPSCRPQESESKSENEASERMGRVDEGVEEFFTKKIIPDYALKGRWEESNPAQAAPSESSTPSTSTPFSSSSDNTMLCTTTATLPSVPSANTSLTPTDVPPLSTSSTPPTSSSVPLLPTAATTTNTTTTTLPTKNIKKKFGDFFAFKRARAGRAAKAGGGEGGGEAVKVKRTSIADLIRPLREAKERERERDMERERERGPRSGEDANMSNDATTTEGTVATSHHLAGDAREHAVPAKTLTTMTPPSETPSCPAIAETPDLTAAVVSNLPEEAVTSLPVLQGHSASPVVTSLQTKQERSGLLMKEMMAGVTGERRLKVTKRSLREGKSQSLILLTGLEAEDKEDAHSKKHTSESASSFEQRLQVMLHRMGVAKTPPADTKTNQNKDEELRKANSEGAILDKPERPPTYMKPRTMSTSSADPRHLTGMLEPIRTDPDPAPPDRPTGPLPPRPAVAAKPVLISLAAAAGPEAPSFDCSVHRVPHRPHPLDDSPFPSSTQTRGQEGSQGAASAPFSRRELLPPWRVPSGPDRSERAHSVTDESLLKPCQHMKSVQRRAKSVHEDTLVLTQELKAVLQRSPIRLQGNRGDLPTCTEAPPGGEEAPGAQGETGETGKQRPDGPKTADSESTVSGCPPESSSQLLLSSARDDALSTQDTSLTPTPDLGRPTSKDRRPTSGPGSLEPHPSTTSDAPESWQLSQGSPQSHERKDASIASPSRSHQTSCRNQRPPTPPGSPCRSSSSLLALLGRTGSSVVILNVNNLVLAEPQEATPPCSFVPDLMSCLFVFSTIISIIPIISISSSQQSGMRCNLWNEEEAQKHSCDNKVYSVDPTQGG